MTTTKEMRLNAFIEVAKKLKNGQGLGLAVDNFIVLVDNIQFKYGYTDEEVKPIWDIINPPETPVE